MNNNEALFHFITLLVSFLQFYYPINYSVVQYNKSQCKSTNTLLLLIFGLRWVKVRVHVCKYIVLHCCYTLINSMLH